MARKPAGKAKGLGRGLSTLLGDAIAAEPVVVAGGAAMPAAAKQTAAAAAVADAAKPEAHAQIARSDNLVAIEKIHPNPDQPRKDFKPSDLEDLAASIREKGVLQPLIVRPDPVHKGEFQIVAGERRWRAAQQAQVHQLPVISRDLSDDEVLELAIIENIQRADLNAVEEAMGFRQLMDSFGHTQEKLAEVMGKSRSYIANALRLLNLPSAVQVHLREGRLSMGHARALITCDNAEMLAAEIIKRDLSVRETEALIKAQKDGGEKPPKTPRPKKDADTRALEADLGANLGLKVSIAHKGQKGGSIKLDYKNLEQLDQICQLLSR